VAELRELRAKRRDDDWIGLVHRLMMPCA